MRLIRRDLFIFVSIVEFDNTSVRNNMKELMKPDLSVCIIAKNESSMLPACIESVLPIAKEIIVVDTGSEDNTVELAHKSGCRVIETTWENDFSKARNIALSAAKYPFILSIDADERLLNPEAISDVLADARATTGAWLIEVKSEAINENGQKDVFLSNLLRLFRNTPPIRYEGIVHEQIIHSIKQNNFEIENSDAKILHLGYSLSAKDMLAKQKRNLNLLNIALDIDSSDYYALLHRAKTHLSMGKLLEAENDIAKVITSPTNNNTLKPQAFNYGAIIAFRLNNLDHAFERAKLSASIINEQVFANFILADLYAKKGDLKNSLKHYLTIEKAIKHPNLKARIMGDYYLPFSELAFKIGRTYTLLADYDKAEEYFSLGNAADKANIHNLVGLANMSFKRARYNDAESYLKEALALSPGNKEILGFLDSLKKQIRKQTETFETIPIDEKQKTGISVSMIVKNEEKMLSGCLESIKDIADEIIIVDTGSTDKTKEIALSYGAKVYDFEWIDDFSAARNYSLKHCKGDWILYLDADERLENESKEELLRVIRTKDNNIGGYICIIQSAHSRLDGSSELHRGGYPRLFKNFGYPSIHFKGRVHEQITPSIISLDKVFVMTDIKIEHLGYNQPREVMESKIKRNYKMLLAHIKEEPTYGYAWYQLGQTLAQMKIFNEAEESIRFALKCGDLSDSIYASATATLAQLTGSQKKFSEALYWAEESLKKAPEQLYSISLKAHALLYLNRLEEAEHYFKLLAKLKESQRGVPLSGFDIEVPDKIIEQGLRELERRKSNQNNLNN